MGASEESGATLWRWRFQRYAPAWARGLLFYRLGEDVVQGFCGGVFGEDEVSFNLECSVFWRRSAWAEVSGVGYAEDGPAREAMLLAGGDLFIRLSLL
jgi:hypothetical protein